MKTPTRRQSIFAGLIAILLCLFPFIPIPILQEQTLHFLLCLPAIVWSLYYLSTFFYLDISQKTLHNNFLWLIAFLSVWGLAVLHYIGGNANHYFWQALAVLMGCFLWSLYLWNQLKARSSVHESRLIKVSEQVKQQKTVWEKGKEAGAEVRSCTVYAGDFIPADGKVILGEGLVNESLLTGNKMLQDKHKGSKVWAGSVLELGQLKMEVLDSNSNPNLDSSNENSSVSFLEQSLLQITALKQSLFSKNSFIPYVNNLMILATLVWATVLAYTRHQALVLVEPPLSLLTIWTESLTIFATLLVVVSPLALAVGTHLSYWRVMDYLFQKGVRLQSSSLVKKIAALKYLIFSKTGVLTTGIFHIQNFHSEIPSNDFKSILLALESHSKHPFAKAIRKHFEGDVEPLQLEDVRMVNGLGVMGKDAEGNTYMVGAYNIAAEFTSEDHHSIYVLVNNELVGWLDLEDRLREEAEPCISALKEQELKVMLLSGDRAIPTQYTARKTGIINYHFQQLFEQKKAIIQEIQSEYLTGMVVERDSEEDLLQNVTVGIELESLPDANGALKNGTNVTIFHHRLLLVRELISMCRMLVNRLRWSMILIVIYNIIAVVLASFGYISLILAAISSFIFWIIIFLLLKI